MQIELSYPAVEKNKRADDSISVAKTASVQGEMHADSGLSCLTLYDGRRRIEYFGQKYPKEQMLAWLKTAVDYRFKIDSVPSLTEADSVPSLTLNKAYITSVGTSMTANAVITVSQGDALRVFRGSKTRMNWAGSDKEFSRILSEALDDALATVTFDQNFSQSCSDSAP